MRIILFWITVTGDIQGTRWCLRSCPAQPIRWFSPIPISLLSLHILAHITSYSSYLLFKDVPRLRVTLPALDLLVFFYITMRSIWFANVRWTFVLCCNLPYNPYILLVAFQKSSSSLLLLHQGQCLSCNPRTLRVVKFYSTTSQLRFWRQDFTLTFWH